MKSPNQAEFVWGTLRAAMAAALIMKSLTEILTLECRFSFSRNCSKESIATFMDTW